MPINVHVKLEPFSLSALSRRQTNKELSLFQLCFYGTPFCVFVLHLNQEVVCHRKHLCEIIKTLYLFHAFLCVWTRWSFL